jgi:hypothetical protein
MSDIMKEGLKGLGNVLEPKMPCWDASDLALKVGADAASGALFGAAFDGFGFLPGAAIGGVAGVAEWAAVNNSRCAAAKNSEAARQLPPLILHGPAGNH